MSIRLCECSCALPEVRIYCRQLNDLFCHISTVDWGGRLRSSMIPGLCLLSMKLLELKLSGALYKSADFIAGQMLSMTPLCAAVLSNGFFSITELIKDCKILLLYLHKHLFRTKAYKRTLH